MIKKGLLVILGILGFCLFWGSWFTVRQNEVAAVNRMGNYIRTYDSPGLKFKAPLLDSVTNIVKSRKMLDLDEKAVNTSDKKTMDIDGFLLYTIVDPVKYLLAGNGSEITVQQRLLSTVNGSLATELALHNLDEIVSDENGTITDRLEKLVNKSVENLGLKVTMICLSKTDLPESNKASVYQRMKAEQQKIAAGLIAEGEEEFKKLTSAGAQEAEQIKSQAYLESQLTIAQAHKEEKGILAEAYKKNPSFYIKWRQLESRKKVYQDSPVEVIYENGKEPHNVATPQ